MIMCSVTAEGQIVSLLLSLSLLCSHPAENQSESKYTCMLALSQISLPVHHHHHHALYWTTECLHVCLCVCLQKGLMHI